MQVFQIFFIFLLKINVVTSDVATVAVMKFCVSSPQVYFLLVTLHRAAHLNCHNLGVFHISKFYMIRSK